MPVDFDPYRILEVGRSASHDDIRKSYKKLARKYHPDANVDDPSALEKFKQVQVAWDILGDKEKRQNFDKYGSADGPQFRGGPEAGGGSGTGGPGAGQPRTWSSADGGEVPFDIEELFGGRSPFGGFGGSAGRGDWPVRGHDVRAKIEVPFTVAAEGGTYDLHLRRGSHDKPETLSVKVPAGIDTGSVIRLAGQGEPGLNGGTAGDLLISVRVAKHPYFRREGSNLLLDVPLGIVEAALGAKVEIPTLSEGTVVMSIPPGSSSGTKLRLKGKGIVDRRTGQRGDQLAVLKIIAPKEVSDRAQELLNELKSVAPQNVRDRLW